MQRHREIKIYDKTENQRGTASGGQVLKAVCRDKTVKHWNYGKSAV